MGQIAQQRMDAILLSRYGMGTTKSILQMGYRDDARVKIQLRMGADDSYMKHTC